jgi:hypothetical protein
LNDCAELALYDALSEQRPGDVEWIRQTATALSNILWLEVPVLSHRTDGVTSALGASVQQQFAALGLILVEDGGESQAEAMGLDLNRLTPKFLEAFVRRLGAESIRRPEVKPLWDALIEELRDAREELIIESVTAIRAALEGCLAPGQSGLHLSQRATFVGRQRVRVNAVDPAPSVEQIAGVAGEQEIDYS